MSSPESEPDAASPGKTALRDHRIVVRRSARYVTLGGGAPIDEVWFVLHGYSQLARHFIRWFEPAHRPGRLIVAPEALSRSYFAATGGGRRVGASWMTKEDRDAEIEDYIQYLDQVAETIVSGLSRHARVEVHGFSQGGAAAARWVAYGRHPIDRLVLWGSLVPPDLDLERLRSRLAGSPLIMALGDRDRYLDQALMQRELGRLDGVQVPVDFRAFSGGHLVDARLLRELGARGAPA